MPLIFSAHKKVKDLISLLITFNFSKITNVLFYRIFNGFILVHKTLA